LAVLLKTSKLLLVAMLSLTLGLQWTVLQSIAWAGMLVQFSRQCSLGQAVAKTFDGLHPCPICQLVRAAKKSEGKPAAQPTLKRFDLLADRTPAFVFLAAPRPVFSWSFTAPERFEAPATPPPRPCLS
jgi:hypothetical protein